MVDSALQRARARALEGVQKVDTPAPQPKAPTPSVRTVKLQTGETVPIEYYDLPAESQQRMLEIIRQQEVKRADDTLALRAANQVMDIQDRDRAEIKALKGQVSTLLGVVEAMQRRLDQRDNQLEVSKSEALLDQQAAIADAVLSAAAVETSLRNQTVASQAEMERQAVESRAALEAQATAIDALKGSVTSTTTLMGERSNAILDQLADAESRQAKLAVQLTENSDGIAANRDTLRAVTGTDFDSAIDLSVKKAFDARLDGALEELIERRYVLLAPTTGTDGYDPKIDSSAKPFLVSKNDQSPRA